MTDQEVTLAAQQVSDVLVRDVQHVEAVAAKVKEFGRAKLKEWAAWLTAKAATWGPWGVVAGLGAKLLGFL